MNRSLALRSRSRALLRCTLAAALSLSLPLLAAVPAHATSARLAPPTAGTSLDTVAERYAREFYALFPLTATENLGDPRYEAAFEIDIAPEHRARQKALYERTLKALATIDPRRLSDEQRLTRDLLAYEVRDRLALLAFPDHLLPLTHINSMPVQLAQWASGAGAQPMRTTANYDHYLARLQQLPAWTEQAIANMETGIARGIVQPRALMERLLPQLDALLPADPAQSPYLQATHHFPESVPAADRERLAQAYRSTVEHDITPALRRLRSYLAERYIPHCRESAGLGELPGGAAWYRALVASSTTTSMEPARIHELGLSEVARIRAEMETVKQRFGYSGPLDEFLRTLPERPQLKPFHSEQEVLQAYAALNRRIQAALPRLFARAPKAPLEIRAVEPMRRDTASDYYSPPAADGSRPGVFYAVVQNPATYTTTEMTALFLHEGQPGHHYQIALQQELDVPQFRRATWYNAFGEGWALYAEGLGRDIGVYDDPNAYLGRLKMELHRAVRLVVDTGLHAQGWSRERAIAYEMSTEDETEDEARRSIERYMAWPGQALAYKIGELKILELRARARRALGPRFDIRAFHTQVLAEGCLPLSMLEKRIDRWIASEGGRVENRATAQPARAASAS